MYPRNQSKEERVDQALSAESHGGLRDQVEELRRSWLEQLRTKNIKRFQENRAMEEGMIQARLQGNPARSGPSLPQGKPPGPGVPPSPQPGGMPPPQMAAVPPPPMGAPSGVPAGPQQPLPGGMVPPSGGEPPIQQQMAPPPQPMMAPPLQPMGGIHTGMTGGIPATAPSPQQLPQGGDPGAVWR